MEFPQPEVGLVISYSYLWSDEAEVGHVEGRKNRPCAIVLVVQQAEAKAPAATVVPITHSPHRNPEAAIEIPAAIKHHLGLVRRSTLVGCGRRFQCLHLARL